VSYCDVVVFSKLGNWFLNQTWTGELDSTWLKQNIYSYPVSWNLQLAYIFIAFLTPKHITTKTKTSPPPLIISSPQKTTPNDGQDALRALRHYADTSRTRRAVLQLLAQELAPDETKELRDIPMFFFRRRKTQGGGALGGWMIHI